MKTTGLVCRPLVLLVLISVAFQISQASAKDPDEIKPILTFRVTLGRAAFLPDPRQFIYREEVWNLETRKRSVSLEDAIGKRRYEFSNDRKFVATLGDFTQICDLEKKTATRVNNYKTDHIAFSPDSRWLATYDMVDEFDRPRSLVVWNIKKRAVQATLAMGSDGDSPLVFSKDSRFLYYATKDELREVAVESCKVTREVKKSRAYSDFWFFESDDRLYSQSGRSTAYSAPIEAIDLSEQKFGEITQIISSKRNLVRNRHRFAATDDAKVLIFDKNGDLEATIDAHERKCNTVALSLDDKYLLTGGDDWRVRLWDAKTHEPVAWMRPARRAITDVAFSSDGKHFLVGTDQLTIWETRDLMALKNGTKK